MTTTPALEAEEKGMERMRYFVWRLRMFLLLLRQNIEEFRRVWHERWYIRQAWSHAMPAATWRDYYDEGYSPQETLKEEAGCQ